MYPLKLLRKYMFMFPFDVCHMCDYCIMYNISQAVPSFFIAIVNLLLKAYKYFFFQSCQSPVGGLTET